MRNSSLTWPTANKEYYNPVSKIRALIKNLDAELSQLCSQCVTSKSTDVVAASSAPTNNVNLISRGGPQPASRIPSNAKPFLIKSESNIHKSKNFKKMNSPGTNILFTTPATSTNTLPLGIPDPQSVDTIQKLAKLYRSRVIDAYRSRRIFTVYGNYHTVRRALLQRGWLEKLAPGRYPKLQGLSEEALLQHAKKGNDYEAVVISKIINHFPPFFIWQPKAQRDYASEVRPLRNRIRRGAGLDFSTKVGLIGCAELEEWYSQEGVSRLSHPRFYRLNGTSEERMAFIDDFRQTQCLSLLRFLSEKISTPEDYLDETNGTIMPTVIQFAIMQTKRQLNQWETLPTELDKIGSATAVQPKDDDSAEWDSFMASSYLILHNRGKFKGSPKEMTEYAKVARTLIDKVEAKYPDYKWDGSRNLWILKPGYQSRGIGIIIRSSLDEILQWTSVNFNRRYIAQKYIERPLLIHKTKFDIRQYMLVSIGPAHVTIWLYKDCYLRFSSQEYSIDDLRESIHLTNNSVQKKYRNKQSRDARLPKHNMWSLDQFKEHLKEIDSENSIWDTKTYPGIKQNMIAVVQASLEETEFVENAFELYGCDFMLDENYHPILIEINATPDLTPSTEVTARICPNVLRDAIRVVVDLPRNAKAPTGQFEKVFEVDYKITRNFDPNSGLNVQGTKMTLFQPIPSLFRPRFWKRVLKTPRTDGQKIAKLKRQAPPVTRPKRIQKSFDVLTKPFEETNTDNTTPLSTADKEALALRYTQPK